MEEGGGLTLGGQPWWLKRSGVRPVATTVWQRWKEEEGCLGWAMMGHPRPIGPKGQLGQVS
jgi:hypothetical protein